MRPLRHLPNSFPAQSFLDIPREVTCNTLPFSHCLITNWVYFKIIITNWAISLSLAFVIASLTQGAEPYAWASFSVITLLVLAVSYIIIFVNVQKQSSFTTSWYSSQRKEIVNNIIDSHWSFPSHHSSYGYPQLPARSRKAKTNGTVGQALISI